MNLKYFCKTISDKMPVLPVSHFYYQIVDITFTIRTGVL